MNVALPSTTIRLEIAFINVSTVEIVNAKPSVIINRDKKTANSKSHQKPPYSRKNNDAYKTEEDWSRFTKRQIDEWGCKYTRIETQKKPSWDLFIDDKTKRIEEI